MNKLSNTKALNPGQKADMDPSTPHPTARLRNSPTYLQSFHRYNQITFFFNASPELIKIPTSALMEV